MYAMYARQCSPQFSWGLQHILDLNLFTGPLITSSHLLLSVEKNNFFPEYHLLILHY